MMAYSRYLCAEPHHRDIHSFGDEVAWWERRAIDPIATSRIAWITTGVSNEANKSCLPERSCG